MLEAMLLYPPITDTTSPYHSLVYLASYARSAGFTRIAIRDTNIEAVNYCARPDVVSAMTAAWKARRRRLGAQASLTGEEQLEYAQLLRAEAVDPQGVVAAIETMRDPTRFYSYDDYSHAARRLQLWLESLSCSGWPGQFEAGGHSLRRSGWLSLSSVADLTNERLLDRLVGPFTAYFEDVLFPQLMADPPRVVGLNVTYTSQLPYALWMVRRIRRLLPETFIVCGGTEVSGVWKYLSRRELMGDLFAGADACVVGEGETAFVKLLEEVIEARPPAPIHNVVRLDAGRGRVEPPPGVLYENLEDLPLPEYGLLDSSLYFSPEPLVYYSPTRGCYWNKCTFCDYGLNFGTPTSPWRQESLERSVSNLQAISETNRHVYLSVDVLAPGRLFHLAEAIADAGIDVRWSAEIRLERYFNAERCRTLARSGCVAVSVGFESGSQRVLDLMDKGVTLPDVETTIQSFSGAGIAVQMMGFTGFPTETPNEAMASVDFLRRTQSHWTTSALGNFTLTPGSILAQTLKAKSPQTITALEGDDIVRTLGFTMGPDAGEGAEGLRRAKRALMTAEFDRPFAGGVDTAHSILFYDRYGKAFPRAVLASARAPRARGVDDRSWVAPNAVALAPEPFDVLRLPATQAAAGMGTRSAAAGRTLDHAAFVQGLAECPLVEPAGVRSILMRYDGVALPCPPSAAALLRWLDGGASLGEACRTIEATFSAEEIETLSDYAQALDAVGRTSSAAEGLRIPEAQAWSIHDILLALERAQILRIAPVEAQAHDSKAEPISHAIHDL